MFATRIFKTSQLPKSGKIMKDPSGCAAAQVQLLEYLQKCPKPTDSRVKAEIVK
jgi:hypothetical protein